MTFERNEFRPGRLGKCLCDLVWGDGDGKSSVREIVYANQLKVGCRHRKTDRGAQSGDGRETVDCAPHDIKIARVGDSSGADGVACVGVHHAT